MNPHNIACTKQKASPIEIFGEDIQNLPLEEHMFGLITPQIGNGNMIFNAEIDRERTRDEMRNIVTA